MAKKIKYLEIKSLEKPPKEQKVYSAKWVVAPFRILLLAGLFILCLKLLSLTLVNGAYYRNLSQNNRLLVKSLPAARGIIYDRKGVALVRNKIQYRLKDNGRLKILNDEEAAKLEITNRQKLLNAEPLILREYLFPFETAHLLGYVSEATPEDLKNGLYKPGDFKGHSGLEETYDQFLRGKDGKKMQEVDALGKPIKDLAVIDPKQGLNLTLTVDLDLQKTARQEMEGRRGAVVATNPQNGEVLLLYSSPSFDLNKPSDYLSDKDGRLPFLNRVITGQYPPGSTFKIVVAAAGLESGKIKPESTVVDNGVLEIGPYKFPNWLWLKRGQTDGPVNVVSALKRSNDIFFYKAGEWTGLTTLTEYAKKFGLGQKLGIDIPGEATGLWPDPEWKLKTKGESWYLGDTYHLAIGQGDLLVTPLQVNIWTAAIASHGIIHRPHFVSSETNSSEGFNLHLKNETVSLIKEGLFKACSPGGTGWPLFDFKVKGAIIKTACKTGTAEFGGPNKKTHAWFTIFAPLENPGIALTVLVEEGGEGSDVAAPVAKKILEKWFEEF